MIAAELTSDSMFISRFMPCPECGASLDRDKRGEHTCDRECWLDYQMFQLRDEVARFEAERHAYLTSPEGRFEQWYARWTRKHDPEP